MSTRALQEPPGSDSMYDSDYNDAGSDMVPGVEQREQSEDSTEQPEPAAEVDGEWGETIVVSVTLSVLLPSLHKAAF